MSDWKDTHLWQKLEKTKAAATLLECMEDIQATLSKGATVPLDFTLHDADHGFRVAQRAAELIPAEMDGALSEIELAQLLMASYLHDIGMSPGREKYLRHRNYLATGDTAHLSQPEQSDLQNWLDEARGGIVPPISATAIDENGIPRIDEIVAYYCRARHNDWSEEWIRENLIELRHPLYHGWVDDLVSLCRSHHEDLLELRTERFDMRVIGAHGQVLNLRFLAGLLRIADVLEFDPERTPNVIMKHRNISAKSKVFWRKDHSIAFNVSPKENSMIISARTPDAPVHRAVIETINWVNAELNTCATLHNEGLFRKGNVPETDKIKYTWPWPPQVRQDVREKDASFVYIDGGFRPDKVKILNLLSGTRIYKNRWAAVRELLQNAIDAVREQIARERLDRDTPEDHEWEGRLGAVHKIRVSFEADGEKYYLVCHDDGVGMDRNIISNHLLVSGAGQRGDLVALERAAANAGFSVGRTGQFGIGLLSYFMIARQVTIQTRRSAQGGDVDGKGWRFTIDGVDSFGELRTESRATAGTSVTLLLHSDIVGDNPKDFVDALFAYIKSTVRYSPCPIDLLDGVHGGAKISLPLGWTEDEEEIRHSSELGIGKTGQSKSEYLPHEELERMRLKSEQAEKIQAEIKNFVKITGPVEGKLIPDGAFRTYLAYLDISGNATLGYMDIEEGIIKKLPNDSEYAELSPSSIMSWRGFRVADNYTTPQNMYCELNLTEGGDIYIDRGMLRNSPDVGPVIKAARDSLLRDFLSAHSTSAFSLLNLRHALQAGFHSAWKEFDWEPNWALLDAGQKRWSKIKFPCVDLIPNRYQRARDPNSEVSVNGIKLAEFAPVATGQYNGFHISSILPTGRLHFADFGYYYGCAFVWESEAELKGVNSDPFFSDFPPGWERLAAIGCHQRIVFNSNSPIAAGVGMLDPLDACTKMPELVEKVRARKNRDEMRRLLLANADHSVRFWNGLRDNFPDAFESLIKVSELPNDELVVWVTDGGSSDDRTIILNMNGATQAESASDTVAGRLVLPDGSKLKFNSHLVTFS